MNINRNYIFTLIVLQVLCHSCIKEPDFSDNPYANNWHEKAYLYPFEKESQNISAEIYIKTTKPLPEKNLVPEIPPLKYNKSWLMMLTQDDCKQAAFSCTWAAINGKPLSKTYFYDEVQLRWGDLPPNIYFLGKTLASTDGSGNEVRFHFTTTVSPGWDFMNHRTTVKPGFTKNYNRFIMQTGLNWNSVRHMLNYGCGIAFHNLNIGTESENMILKYFPVEQDTILKYLDGRGCKTLAEPDGNKNYVYAAQQYPPIQAMTAQGGTMVKVVYPFQYNKGKDLYKILQYRVFNDNPDAFRAIIGKELGKKINERAAIHIGVHGTDTNWVNLLLWINDTYGKDGDDSVWFPNLEEYYEYNYYRAHAQLQLERMDEHTLKLTVSLSSGTYFYYPSVTVNIPGLSVADILEISSDNNVTGLSYANIPDGSGETGYLDGLMLNIDCRRFLAEHATHYVEEYEQDKSNSSKRADALYFTNMLKKTEQKDSLLNRIR